MQLCVRRFIGLIRRDEWPFEDMILGTEETQERITTVMTRYDQTGEGVMGCWR